MSTRQKILIILVVLSLFSCGKKESDGTDSMETREQAEKPKETEKPGVYVENLYATSIHIPHNTYGPRNLFDNDETTVWMTMPGAGPDEGVYIGFEKAQFIDSILLTAPEGKGPGVSRYRMYINGVETKEYKTDNSKVTIRKTVKTLYIRLVDHTKNFPDTRSAVFSELKLYAKDNSIIQLVPARKIGGKVSASSSLDPYESYNVDFLFDSRMDFGWADGNPDKSGAGEYLEFSFNEKVTIDKIKLWNGYQRSEAHYEGNERVKTVEFGIKGQNSQSFAISDSASAFITPDNPLEGKDFVLRITEVYPGTKYRDLVISELRFYNGEDAFVVNTGGMENRKKKLMREASENGLDAVMDKRLYDYSEDVDYNRQQSLILRSNGSFILWFTKEEPEVNTIRYADGNWQIQDDKKIKIFGRIHTLKTYTDNSEYDPYAGRNNDGADMPEDENSIVIFHDFLTVNQTGVKSQKGLFEEFTL